LDASQTKENKRGKRFLVKLPEAVDKQKISVIIAGSAKLHNCKQVVVVKKLREVL
jgi:hypothetical protein